MECYFDNSATTPLREEVLQEMMRAGRFCFANPSSPHRPGLEAERKMKEARVLMAASLGAQPKEIFFTSGGTEANNLGIKGTAKAAGKRGRHIISSMAEHDSVYGCLKYLESEGFSVTYLRPDSRGRIRTEQVGAALREDTFLIALMHINNEVGAVLNIEELSSEVQRWNRDRKIPLFFHLDAVQSYLRRELDMRKLGGVSSLSISAHKVHGPKGVGALYLREGVRALPLFHGGGQEGGQRSGTENTIGIFGFAKAVALQAENIGERRKRLGELREHFYRGVSRIPDVVSHSPEDGAEHICSLAFLGVPGEVLIHSLEQERIYVSTGAACSSKKKGSRVLESLNLPKTERESTLRFSFSEMNTAEEIDYAVSLLEKKVGELRGILKYRSRKNETGERKEK